mgnify:CR=1 FL=1
MYDCCLFVVEEIQRVNDSVKAIHDNKNEQLGACLYQTHQGLSELYQVSCVELDYLVKEAKKSKEVLGARMMGGGFGGCTINLVKKGSESKIKEKFTKLYAEHFKIDLITYDVNGRIASITNNEELTRVFYTYDNLDRIIRVDKLGTGNPTDPYEIVSYAEYQYESHKNSVYQFFKEQMDFDQLLFSPIDIYPFFSRVFYSAAAIASFAFNAPHAVLDGNVFRVIARYEGIDVPTDTTAGKRLFETRAAALLDKKRAGLYNQAIMDFGATVCTPNNPDCVACNLSSKCVAFNVNQVNQLPVKLKRITKKKRHFDFFCFNYNGTWMLQQRGEGDVWNGLFQFYVLEQDRMPVFSEDYLGTVLKHQFGLSQKQWKYIGACKQPQLFKQVLTHQTIEARFICIQLSKMPKMLQNALWVKPKQLSKYAFPKIINDFLVTFHHGSALE